MSDVNSNNQSADKMQNKGIKDTQKKTVKIIVIGLAIMVIAVPLGLLAVGTAYAEWGSEDLQEELGYVPAGIEQGEGLWISPFPDYAIGNLNPNIGYWLSAIFGVVLIVVIFVAIGKLMVNKRGKN